MLRTAVDFEVAIRHFDRCVCGWLITSLRRQPCRRCFARLWEFALCSHCWTFSQFPFRILPTFARSFRKLPIGTFAFRFRRLPTRATAHLRGC